MKDVSFYFFIKLFIIQGEKYSIDKIFATKRNDIYIAIHIN